MIQSERSILLGLLFEVRVCGVVTERLLDSVQSGGVIRIKILKIDFVFVRSHSLYVIEQ